MILKGTKYNKANIFINRKVEEWAGIFSEEIKAKILSAWTEGSLFVTGGSVLSVITGSEINDIDLYCSDIDLVKSIVTSINYKNIDPLIGYVLPRDFDYNDEGISLSKELEDNVEGLIDCRFQDPVAFTKTKNKGVRLQYASSSALSYTNGIQLITRFVGTPEEIHSNFDFTICTGLLQRGVFSIDPVVLQAIAEKELKYMKDSQYPLAGLFRVIKYVKKGYNIRHMSLLQIALELQNIDLTNPKVLKDQLNGVDQVYTSWIIKAINDYAGEIDTSVIYQIIEQCLDGGSYEMALESTEPLDEEKPF